MDKEEETQDLENLDSLPTKPTSEDLFNNMLIEFPEYMKELASLLKVSESNLFSTLTSIKSSKIQTNAFLNGIDTLLISRRLKE